MNTFSPSHSQSPLLYFNICSRFELKGGFNVLFVYIFCNNYNIEIHFP